MKYEYLKGSEKDFEGAPEWAHQVIKSTSIYGYAFVDEFDYMCKYQARENPCDIGNIVNPSVWKVIAERRPITELSWNGAGLPPVGCECEASIDGGESWDSWYTMAEDSGVVIFGYLDGNHVAYGKRDMPIFRPIRSEADKKRDEAVEAMNNLKDYGTGGTYLHVIYDAIAAGKIPGVKLED